MDKQLEQVCKKKMLSAIYSDKSDCDKFAVGYIISFTSEFTLIKHFNPHGDFDGYSVRITDSIYRIETNSRYIKKVKKLMDYKKADQNFEISINGNLMTAIIDFAQKDHRIASIEIDEDSDNVVGYINFFTDKTIGILQVSDYGEDDGETVFLTEDILEVCIGNLNIVDFELLYEYNGGRTDRLPI